MSKVLSAANVAAVFSELAAREHQLINLDRAWQVVYDALQSEIRLAEEYRREVRPQFEADVETASHRHCAALNSCSQYIVGATAWWADSVEQRLDMLRGMKKIVNHGSELWDAFCMAEQSLEQRLTPAQPPEEDEFEQLPLLG